MREISDAEALVLADLLADPDRERSTRRSDAVPRRTRQAIRQRLHAREVVQSRYVPDPALLGNPFVTFAMAQPFAEAWSETARRWGARTESVDLWALRDMLFGVFLLPSAAEAEALQDSLAGPGICASARFLCCDSRGGTIPVFFDFEAAWVALEGLGGTLAYPQPLTSSTLTAEVPRRDLPKADREALRQMVGRPLVAPIERDGRSTQIHRPRLRARERRLLRDGACGHREFLDPRNCRRWARGFPELLVFVWGNLIEGKAAPDLFRSLVERSGVHPFLFVTDGSTLLLGALSRRATESPGRTVAPRDTALVTIESYLQRVVVLRKPLEDLEVLVDHRYDRPFREGGSGTSGDT